MLRSRPAVRVAAWVATGLALAGCGSPPSGPATGPAPSGPTPAVDAGAEAADDPTPRPSPRRLPGPGTEAPSGGAETAATAPSTPAALEPSEPFAVDTVTLVDGDASITVPVYVADTDALRARGLMGRESLPEGTGMVFVYTDDRTGSFWMRDTLIPLSIAFADASGEIIDIQDMEPCTALPCPRHAPAGPYRTALEVPQGWFTAQGVEPGWRLTDVPQPDAP